MDSDARHPHGTRFIPPPGTHFISALRKLAKTPASEAGATLRYKVLVLGYSHCQGPCLPVSQVPPGFMDWYSESLLRGYNSASLSYHEPGVATVPTAGGAATVPAAGAVPGGLGGACLVASVSYYVVDGRAVEVDPATLVPRFSDGQVREVLMPHGLCTWHTDPAASSAGTSLQVMSHTHARIDITLRKVGGQMRCFLQNAYRSEPESDLPESLLFRAFVPIYHLGVADKSLVDELRIRFPMKVGTMAAYKILEMYCTSLWTRNHQTAICLCDAPGATSPGYLPAS